MGHRIEILEIEVAALSLPGLNSACCLYKPEKEMIWLFYTGTVEKKELAIHPRNHLPRFMVPRRFMHFYEFPCNSSGKVDTNQLREYMG